MYMPVIVFKPIFVWSVDTNHNTAVKATDLIVHTCFKIVMHKILLAVEVKKCMFCFYLFNL